MLVFSPSLWCCYLLHFCHACLNLLFCDLVVAQCSSFVKHLEWITAMCFVTMLECGSIVSCCILDGIVLLIADCAIIALLAICKPCIRFRWSLYQFRPKSSHLSRGILGLPIWCLFHPFSSGARICIAYHISHIMPCIASCCLCISRDWLLVLCLCSCFG